MEHTTQNIYDRVGKGIVNSVVEGYNGTLFCYGQTSSGKTFTMTGTDELDGIVQFAVRDMFRLMKRSVDRKFQVRLSFPSALLDTLLDWTRSRATWRASDPPSGLGSFGHPSSRSTTR